MAEGEERTALGELRPRDEFEFGTKGPDDYEKAFALAQWLGIPAEEAWVRAVEVVAGPATWRARCDQGRQGRWGGPWFLRVLHRFDLEHLRTTDAHEASDRAKAIA